MSEEQSPYDHGDGEVKTSFERFMDALSDPREKLAASLTGVVCGQCRCSNEYGYTKPEMQASCECYQEAGRVIELIGPMLNAELREENAKLKMRVEELEKRLGLDSVCVLSDGEEHKFPDGIASRDMEIALLEELVDDLREENAKLKRSALVEAAVEQSAEIIRLRTQVKKLREAIKPLIELAAEYQIHHDGIMWAWIDKASPDAVEALNSLRGKLFEVGKAARAAYEETGESK